MEHFIFPNPAAGGLFAADARLGGRGGGDPKGVPAGGDSPQKREAQVIKDLACPSFRGADALG